MRIKRVATDLVALGVSERSEIPVLPVHLPQMRPPSSSPGSICHLPPTRGGLA